MKIYAATSNGSGLINSVTLSNSAFTKSFLWMPLIASAINPSGNANFSTWNYTGYSYGPVASAKLVGGATGITFTISHNNFGGQLFSAGGTLGSYYSSITTLILFFSPSVYAASI